MQHLLLFSNSLFKSSKANFCWLCFTLTVQTREYYWSFHLSLSKKGNKETTSHFTFNETLLQTKCINIFSVRFWQKLYLSILKFTVKTVTKYPGLVWCNSVSIWDFYLFHNSKFLLRSLVFWLDKPVKHMCHIMPRYQRAVQHCCFFHLASFFTFVVNHQQYLL